MTIYKIVLVPFYRGAVVFPNIIGRRDIYKEFSSPFIEERLYFLRLLMIHFQNREFSSPFIEERLYFLFTSNIEAGSTVLVPFYRGAVVFQGG